MQDLRQSTASQIISLGQFLDSTDGDSEENGLTIANTDIKLRKNGATTLANKNSGGATNISNGVYHATLNATDSNTLGRLEIYVHVAGALAVKATFRVLTATAFDAIYTGTFNNLGGTAQTGDNFARIGVAGAGLTAINLPNQTMDITGNITGNLSGSVGSVTAAVTVGTMNANVINAASIAAAAMDNKGNWNVGKTGYSLTQTFPSNFADLAITVTTGLMSVGTNNDKTGYSLTQSFPTNFASQVISAGGATDSLVQGYINTTLTESSVGRINDNIEFFYDNSNAQTTKTVDDVGVAGSGLTQQNVRDAMKLTPTAGAPSSDSVDEHLDTIDAATQATAIRSALGLATANMDVQFAASVTATGFNIGKTGYTLTQSFPSNFASLVISATGDANSDVNKINSTTVLGNGTAGNLWRGS